MSIRYPNHPCFLEDLKYQEIEHLKSLSALLSSSHQMYKNKTFYKGMYGQAFTMSGTAIYASLSSWDICDRFVRLKTIWWLSTLVLSLKVAVVHLFGFFVTLVQSRPFTERIAYPELTKIRWLCDITSFLIVTELWVGIHWDL